MYKLLFFPMLFLAAQTAHSKKVKIDKVLVTSGMNIDVVEAQDLKARVFGYEFGLEVEDKISRDLTLFFKGSAILEKGSNEVVAGLAEFAPTESLSLHSGGVLYQPFSKLMLRAGALNQGELNSPLLVSATGFTAIEEKLSLGNFYFKAQQAIPNNNRLSEKIGETLDSGTPFFGTESLGFNYVNKQNHFDLALSHFKFKDLSNEIAEKSNLLGNSVSGTGLSTEFLYGFEGYNFNFNAQYFINWFRLRLFGQYLYNDKAPDERNKGELVGLSLGSLHHDIFLESFRSESDSSPGFYNSKYYGHNNYSGSAFGYGYAYKELSFSIKYYDLNIIEESSIQEDTEILTLNLTKKYLF